MQKQSICDSFRKRVVDENSMTSANDIVMSPNYPKRIKLETEADCAITAVNLKQEIIHFDVDEELLPCESTRATDCYFENNAVTAKVESVAPEGFMDPLVIVEEEFDIPSDNFDEEENVRSYTNEISNASRENLTNDMNLTLLGKIRCGYKVSAEDWIRQQIYLKNQLLTQKVESLEKRHTGQGNQNTKYDETPGGSLDYVNKKISGELKDTSDGFFQLQLQQGNTPGVLDLSVLLTGRLVYGAWRNLINCTLQHPSLHMSLANINFIRLKLLTLRIKIWKPINWSKFLGQLNNLQTLRIELKKWNKCSWASDSKNPESEKDEMKNEFFNYVDKFEESNSFHDWNAFPQLTGVHFNIRFVPEIQGKKIYRENILTRTGMPQVQFEIVQIIDKLNLSFLDRTECKIKSENE